MVTISGTNLFGYGPDLQVARLAGVAVKQVVSKSDSEIVVVAAASTGTSDPITLVSSSGALITQAGSWTYVPVSNIAAVTPNSGQIDTRVTITGTNLLNGADRLPQVWLDGTPVKSIVSDTDTLVTVIADGSTATATGSGSGSGSLGGGDVVLLCENGAAAVSPGGWNYIVAGSIASVVPSTGQFGTLVTISGSNLFGGGPAIDFVTLAGESTTLLSSDNTEIIVRVPAATPKSGAVLLVSESGATVTKLGGWALIRAELCCAKPGRVPSQHFLR